GIPQIGQVAARQLAETAHTLAGLLAWSAEEARERVAEIHGFGPRMVESVVDFLSDEEELRVMRKLLVFGVGAPQPRHESAVEGPLVGSSFCVTGVLSRRREDVHADLRAAGAVVNDTVKKGTSYLVAGAENG